MREGYSWAVATCAEDEWNPLPMSENLTFKAWVVGIGWSEEAGIDPEWHVVVISWFPAALLAAILEGALED